MVMSEADARMRDELAHERLLAERVTATGTVKRIDAEGGFAVISPDEGDEDLVFRSTNLALSVGVRVAFEVDVGHSGLEARNVIRTPPGYRIPS